MKALYLFFIMFAHAAMLPGQDTNNSGALALTGVTIIDATGAPPQPNMTVVVNGGRIVAIGRSGEVAVSKDARVVDAQGKFLIPGLWDMHVHLSKIMASALPALVANGVTGVRDMGGKLDEIDAWRARIAARLLLGPRTMRAGPTVNGQQAADHHLLVTTGCEAQCAVRTLQKVGVDFIKIHNALSREAYFELAKAAKRLSIPFAGHIPKTITPFEASDAGQASFEHVETLFEGTFSASTKRENLLEAVGLWKKEESSALFARLVRNGTVMTPTLVAYRAGTQSRESKGTDSRDRYISQSAKKVSEERLKPLPPEIMTGRKRLFVEFIEIVGMMHKAGITMMIGTDLSASGVYPGFSVHDEMALFVEAGLSPMAALQAATRNPASFFGKQGEFGTVEPGKSADLVLLDVSPLEDIRNISRIHAVILNGRFLDRLKLNSLLAESEAQAKIQ